MRLWGLVALALLGHGALHVFGTGRWSDRDPSFKSWALPESISIQAKNTIASALFAICAVAFFVSGLSMFARVVPFRWWRPVTDSGAVLSLATLSVFYNALPSPMILGFAIGAIDVLIVGNWLQIWDWPM
jgi:hypothetical protein